MCAIGAVLVVIGCGLVLRSGLLLLGRGRPRRGPKPALVIAGPYRRMRNPLVTGLLVAAAGVTLAAHSPGLAVVTVLAAAGIHVWIVCVEEPRLTARFGAAYEAYLRYVP